MSGASMMYLLWLGSALLQSACAYLLWRNKLRNDFNFLFSYLILQTVKNLVLFSVYQTHNYQLYFYCYWVGTAVADICAFLVLHEVFCAAFRPFAGLRDMAEVVVL